jgi:hypothetical protein
MSIDIDKMIAENRKRKPGSIGRRIRLGRDSAKAFEPAGTR